MTDSVLLIERDGAIATVTLNRPDQMNALSAALRLELGRSFRELPVSIRRTFSRTAVRPGLESGLPALLFECFFAAMLGLRNVWSDLVCGFTGFDRRL
jgi:hypothetical protein